MRVILVAAGANTGAVTFAPNGLTAHAVVKGTGAALVAGDIPGAGYRCDLEYNLATTQWFLLNPGTSNLVLNPAPANLGYNGTIVTNTAGENLIIGNICYEGPDGNWWKAIGNLPSVWVANHAYAVGTLIKPTANQNYFYFCSTAGTSAAVTEPTWGTTIGGTTADGTGALVWTCIDTNSIAGRLMATTTINSGAAGVFLRFGFIRYDSWTGTLTTVTGQPLYIDNTTAGAFTQIRPATSGNLVQLMGRGAKQAKTIMFDPIINIKQVSP